eukprot:SAG11_NODE_1253_length_5385_cov_1.942679_4_plen_108_part_00
MEGLKLFYSCDAEAAVVARRTASRRKHNLTVSRRRLPRPKRRARICSARPCSASTSASKSPTCGRRKHRTNAASAVERPCCGWGGPKIASRPTAWPPWMPSASDTPW